MKYFCTTELVAMYLQKHIVYRKRKIFFGDGTPQSVVTLIGPKHKGETFLIAQSDNSSDALSRCMEEKHLDYKTGIFVKSVIQDIKDIDMSSFYMAVMYNPADLNSLLSNFPDFKQGELKMLAYGKTIAKAMEEAGLRVDVKAPTPEAPSVARAIELYLEGSN